MTPETWGPHVWRLLHLLADVSDRRDIYPLWNTFMRNTALAIPCQKCQIHMKDYLVHHTFMPKDWQKLSADDTRQRIRVWIHEFHNAVNARLGKPCPPLVSSPDSRARAEIMSEITTMYETVKEYWGRVAFLSGPAFLEWKRGTALLIQLVRGGTY
jgi:Erv1 / Alr family